MKEQELRERLNSLTGPEIPAETHRAFLSAASPGKEAKVMKKKISAGLVFALVLALLAVAAIAAGIGYNLEWWYTERNGEVDPAVMQEMLDHRVEDPEQRQAADSLVNVSIREISMLPEDGSHHLGGKFYSAGDMRNGQSLVVRALADGRAAAKEIDQEISFH